MIKRRSDIKQKFLNIVDENSIPQNRLINYEQENKMNTLNILLAKAAKNDQVAFQQLYKEASPKLFALSLRLMNQDHGAAEEVLQEAFIKIWNKADKYEADKGQAMTWMSRVVRNQAFDRLRSYKSRPVLVEELDHDIIENTSKDAEPEQQNSHAEQLLVFKEILESLPKKQRECVTHSLVYGRSHSEIAEEMQIPLGTVKAWLRRNIKIIQETMSDTTAYGY